MNKRMLVFIVLIFIFMVPWALFSAIADLVSGDVTYSHYKSPWQDLEVGMTLTPGDITKTEINSEAILLDDGVEIHILENSTFTLSERYEDEKKKLSFMLFLGRLRFKLAKSRKEEPEIRTQTVNLAIRGTEFEVGAGYNGSTIVLMKEGSVAVQGKTAELLLKEGEGTEVGFGEEPTEKFEVMVRVIDWDEWFSYTKESIKGNELGLLTRILEKFKEMYDQIKEYEVIREKALEDKEKYLAMRDELIKEDKKEEATEYSKKAGLQSKKAFHSIVNIRFLALSSIGLYDMAERIYTGVEEPPKEIIDVFKQIQDIYNWIEGKYIMAGDRERLEEKAKKKKGCLTLF